MPSFLIHDPQPSPMPPKTLVALDGDHARQLVQRRGASKQCELEQLASDGPDVVHRADDFRELVQEVRRRGGVSGLAPTMGALHAGHISLVEASRRHCDFTAATIFVNPTQFGPSEDFGRYPRTLENDLAMLRDAKADACFVPDVDEMYPRGSTTLVAPPAVAKRWEGECRPGHFEGVATIVLKLLNVAPVDIAFFGSKDYQQALVIQQMVADLLVATEIRRCPIVREEDGLALSSRNRYLSSKQRSTALAVPQCLQSAEDAIADGERDPRVVGQAMRRALTQGSVTKIDYAEVVDPRTLEPLTEIDRPVVAIVAAFVGQTRLIDNREILPPGISPTTPASV